MTEDETPIDETQITDSNEVRVINYKEIHQKQEEIANLILSELDDPKLYLEKEDYGNEKFNIFKKEKTSHIKIFFALAKEPEKIMHIHFSELSRIFVDIYDESYLEKLKEVLKEITEIPDKRIYIE